MPENTALTTSFFFHPLAQIYVFTLLLSSFTPTRANARAHARKGARVRGGGERRKKFWRSSRRVTQCHTNATRPPTLAVVATVRVVATSDPLGARDASRGHTVAHGGAAKVAAKKPAARWSMGPSWPEIAEDGREIGHHFGQSLFSLPERIRRASEGGEESRENGSGHLLADYVEVE